MERWLFQNLLVIMQRATTVPVEKKKNDSRHNVSTAELSVTSSAILKSLHRVYDDYLKVLRLCHSCSPICLINYLLHFCPLFSVKSVFKFHIQVFLKNDLQEACSEIFFLFMTQNFLWNLVSVVDIIIIISDKQCVFYRGLIQWSKTPKLQTC